MLGLKAIVGLKAIDSQRVQRRAGAILLSLILEILRR
jgi:hypothetical protein